MEMTQTQANSREEFNNLTRDQMILEYLPYVKRIVNRIAIHLPPSVDTEDLVQVGIVGLIQAIERFDPTRDNKFTTYAAFPIAQRG